MAQAVRNRFAIPQTLVLAAACIMTLAMPGAAAAQSGEKADSVTEDALDAVTQPLQDLNLRSKDVPTILIIAQAAPYELAAVTGQADAGDCQLIQREILQLEEVLGPDADRDPAEKGLANKGLQMGGSILGGFIPFRGVVRQLSGANAEREKMDRAIYAGIARRSYLKGYAQGIGCGTVEEMAVQSAEEVLGMSGR